MADTTATDISAFPKFDKSSLIRLWKAAVLDLGWPADPKITDADAHPEIVKVRNHTLAVRENYNAVKAAYDAKVAEIDARFERDVKAFIAEYDAKAAKRAKK